MTRPIYNPLSNVPIISHSINHTELTEDSTLEAYFDQACSWLQKFADKIDNKTLIHNIYYMKDIEQYQDKLIFPFSAFQKSLTHYFHNAPTSKMSMRCLYYLYCLKHKTNFEFTNELYNDFIQWVNTEIDDTQFKSSKSMEKNHYLYFNFIYSSKTLPKIISNSIQGIKNPLEFAFENLNPPEGQPSKLEKKLYLQENNITSVASENSIPFWTRNRLNTSIATPSLARDIITKQKVEINNNSLINDYETETKISLNEKCLIKTTKARTGSINSKRSALEYVLKMLLLNKEKENIEIIDTRYISTTENYDAALIDSHVKEIEEVLEKIKCDNSDKISETKLKQLMSDVMGIRFPNPKKNSSGFMEEEPHDFYGSDFFSKIKEKEVFYTQFKICANSFLGQGFGFDDESNRHKFSQFEALIARKEIENTTIEKEALKTFWRNELKEITIPQTGSFWNYFIKPFLFIGTVALTAVHVVSYGGYKFLTFQWGCLANLFTTRFYRFELTAFKMIKDNWGRDVLSGEKALLTDVLITQLCGLHDIVSSSGCKSNKDRGCNAQMLEASMAAVWKYRASKRNYQFNANDFSILHFELKDDQERSLVGKVLESNIPHDVTFFNTGVKGTKSLDGIKHIINQAFIHDHESKKHLKYTLVGDRKNFYTPLFI